jgi:hypothetical protein
MNSKRSKAEVSFGLSLAGYKSISITQAYIDINDDMLRSAVKLAC